MDRGLIVLVSALATLVAPLVAAMFGDLSCAEASSYASQNQASLSDQITLGVIIAVSLLFTIAGVIGRNKRHKSM
jgi:hypothetical protein